MSNLTQPALIVQALIRAVKNILERRRIIAQLGGLDDHMLHDIGITRQDVASVLAEPLFGDPLKKLAERARATKLAGRAAHLDHLVAEKGFVAASSTPASRNDAEPRRAA